MAIMVTVAVRLVASVLVTLILVAGTLLRSALEEVIRIYRYRSGSRLLWWALLGFLAAVVILFLAHAAWYWFAVAVACYFAAIVLIDTVIGVGSDGNGFTGPWHF